MCSSGCGLNDIFLDFVVATRHNRFTKSCYACMERTFSSEKEDLEMVGRNR